MRVSPKSSHHKEENFFSTSFMFYVGEMWMFTVCIVDIFSSCMSVQSLCCTPYTYTMLYLNYISIKWDQ